MRLISGFTLLFILNACNIESENSQKNKVSDNLLKNNIKTQFIKADDIACNFKNGKLDTRTFNTDHTIVNGVQQTKIDIIFPKSISVVIIKEITDSLKKDERFSAKEFWSLLSHKSKNLLNEYLIENYSTSNDKDFNYKRRVIAYGFSIFIEDQNYQQAIRLKAPASKQFKEFTIAFSYDIRERIDLKICNFKGFSKIEVPENLLVPSSVITNLLCKDYYEENIISIQVRDNQMMYLHIETPTINEKIKMPLSNIETRDNKHYKTIKYKDEEQKVILSLKKSKHESSYYNESLRTHIHEVYDYLNLNYINEGSHKLKLQRLDCLVTKPF